MKLVDMDHDRADVDPFATADAAIAYPEGLRLTLDDATLARLALDDVAVGDVVRLAARAKVVSYTESAGDDDDDAVTCRLELQIVALGVDPDAAATRARRDDDRLDELGGYA